MHIIPLLSNSWSKDLWHVGIQKVMSEGSNTDNVFFWLMGLREDQNATTSLLCNSNAIARAAS